MSALRGGTGLPREAAKGVLILLALAMILAGLAAAPYLWLGGVKEDIASAQAQLALVKARAEKIGREGVASLTADDHVERMFLAGGTDGIALAAFQRIVAEAAVRSGASVLRMQPLESEAAAPLTTYRLAVDAAGSLEQMRALLTDLESMLPLVFVSDMQLQPEKRADAESQPYPSDSMMLSMRLEAHGWRAPQ